MFIYYNDSNPADGLVEGTDGKPLSLPIDENNLGLYYHDGATWLPVHGSIVNPDENSVSASVDSLVRFAIFVKNNNTGQIASPELFTPNGDGYHDWVSFQVEGNAKIQIFDLRGCLIKTLADIRIWDGTDDCGELAESGGYVYQIHKDGEFITGTVVLIR
ncbi:MAG: T9SS type B sorting domain-containing protein [Candidatus Desantisbacteria bacterium]